MLELKLRYFDFNGGRGEVARLAMAIGGVPFEDDRIPLATWPSVREQTPFHAVPVLEVDGEVITQSNVINRYVGRLANLYPETHWRRRVATKFWMPWRMSRLRLCRLSVSRMTRKSARSAKRLQRDRSSYF